MTHLELTNAELVRLHELVLNSNDDDIERAALKLIEGLHETLKITRIWVPK